MCSLHCGWALVLVFFFLRFPGLSESNIENEAFVATCDKQLCSLCVETLPRCLMTMTLTSSVALRLQWL